jgi:stalled ribosome rescue protein Dom34
MQNTAAHHSHAIVFIDHHEAHVLYPAAANSDGGRVVEHRLAKTKDGHRHDIDRKDLEAVAGKLTGVGEILIAGPSGAKQELFRFLQSHHADIARCVVEVVPLDHRSLAEVMDFGREKFKRIDLWR